MNVKTIRKVTSFLLAAAIIFYNFHGSYILAHASQTGSQSNFEFTQAKAAFAALKQEYDLYGVVTGGETIPVYEHASANTSVVGTLASGSQVTLADALWDGNTLWFQIAFAVHDTKYNGYLQSEHIVTADPRLSEWQTQYLPDNIVQSFQRGAAKGSSQTAAFPASYRPLIQKLLQLHPNWNFVPMNTGLEWEDVLKAEMVDSRNLVQTYHPDTWKSTKPGDYDAKSGTWVIKSGTDWVQAAESIVKYYLDPRNFLTEESVFQFEQLVYGSHHTKAGVEKILKGTFMANKPLEDGSADGITYAKAFVKIGKSLKVSPYFLASRVRQEQGVNGDSPLISGTYPGYEGYYNYFNRRASGVGEEVFRRGLEEAKANGWNTRYKALKGGAKSTASDFIYKGQDTLYLQKFDVDSSYDGLYWHQYMQNLLAADNEGKTVQKSYQEMGILNNSFVFKIPVYNNMPATPCPKPQESLSKPSLTAKQNGYASVKLSWNETAAAQGYQVYRAEGANGTFKKIKTIKGGACFFEDISAVPGKLYRYKVRAYLKLNGKNQYSAYSDIKSADMTIPATAWKDLSIKNYRTIELSWKKKSVDGYKVYRKTNNEGYRCIQTLRGKSSIRFQDTSVKPGRTYTYRIRGYITVNGKDYYSPYTSVKAAEITMARPKLKKASSSNRNKINLTWKRDAMADGYHIYRSRTQKGGYKKVKEITKNKTVKWADTGVKPGKTYYYKIRSYVNVPTGTKASGYSEAAGVTVQKK